MIDISSNTPENLEETYAALEEFVCHIYSYKTFNNVNLVRVAAFMKTYKVRSKEEVLRIDQNFEGSMLPPCKRELQQHLLRTTYIAQLWSNANLAIPNSSSPTDYGWVEQEGKFIFKWFQGEQLPMLTSILNENREISGIAYIYFFIILMNYIFRNLFHISYSYYYTEITEDTGESSETEDNSIIEDYSDSESEEEIYYDEESSNE